MVNVKLKTFLTLIIYIYMVTCKGKTHNGTMCTRTPTKGSKYCYQHQYQNRQNGGDPERLATKQKQCFDIINQEDVMIDQYLAQDADNLILTNENLTQLSCYTGELLQQWIKTPENVYYPCLEGGDLDHRSAIVRIPAGNLDYYVHVGDLLHALKQKADWNFMTLIPTGISTGRLMSQHADMARHGEAGTSYVSALHCQAGSERQLYTIITYNVNDDKQKVQQHQTLQQSQERESTRQRQEHQRQEHQRQERQRQERQRIENMSRSELQQLFIEACSYGRVDDIYRLSQPPFSLGQEDARANLNEALVSACQNGHTEVVRILSQPPFSLGQEDARTQNNEALIAACTRGHADVVRLLSQPPFSLGPEDARAQDNEPLIEACSHGHAVIVYLLSQPPFSLGQEDARVFDNEALRLACHSGHTEVVRLLSLPPYSLSLQDATSAGCDLESYQRTQRQGQERHHQEQERTHIHENRARLTHALRSDPLFQDIRSQGVTEMVVDKDTSHLSEDPTDLLYMIMFKVSTNPSTELQSQIRTLVSRYFRVEQVFVDENEDEDEEEGTKFIVTVHGLYSETRNLAELS